MSFLSERSSWSRAEVIEIPDFTEEESIDYLTKKRKIPKEKQRNFTISLVVESQILREQLIILRISNPSMVSFFVSVFILLVRCTHKSFIIIESKKRLMIHARRTIYRAEILRGGSYHNYVKKAIHAMLKDSQINLRDYSKLIFVVFFLSFGLFFFLD